MFNRKDFADERAERQRLTETMPGIGLQGNSFDRKNKDGIRSRFLREPGIGYARTHGNLEYGGARVSRSTGSEAGGIVKTCRITYMSDQMCLIKFKRQRR